METMTTEQFWYIGAMAANPIIFIVLIAAIFWLLKNLIKSEKWCKVLAYDNKELSNTVDKLCTQLECKEVQLTETKKKLIDALQQKTRANDYAKSVELKNVKNQQLIDRLRSVNETQSKRLKKFIKDEK